MEANIDDIMKWEEYLVDDADIVIVAFGSTSRSARFAVNEARKQGIKAGLFRLITFWPFPEKQSPRGFPKRLRRSLPRR